MRLVFLLAVPVCLLAENFMIQTAEAQSYNVRETQIRFLNGVGRGPTSPPPDNSSYYYRGYGMPGTLIELTAEMFVGGSWGAPMYGDVDFEITFNDGTNFHIFNVTIPSGSFTATASIPYNDTPLFPVAEMTSPITKPWTYDVTDATGTYVNTFSDNGVMEVIYWDNADPPSTGTPAITVQATESTTTSLTIRWTALDTNTPGTNMDGDFYEYRVYYREEGNVTYKQWNGSNDSTLRGLSNNPYPAPVSDVSRHFDASAYKYTTITNLKIFTGYEYYVTAVDVFGNEITEADAGPAVGSRYIRTQPYSVQITISDGIDSYTDFSNLADPTLRQLRATNTKVTINIVAASGEPDALTVWYTTVATEPLDIVDTATNDANSSAFTGSNALLSVDAVRTNPNIWVAYIPTKTTPALLVEGNSIRFVVESEKSGVKTFSDYDLTDGDPNDDEWNYNIGTSTTFTPWPVRILNNVITSKNPRAYPSYYLSDDAYVTIRVYDIKGRPISTLLDKAFRRGGQNIKEDGWNGTNKSNNKVGVGLYYIHIRAERQSDGKIILNSFKKVVMAR